MNVLAKSAAVLAGLLSVAGPPKLPRSATVQTGSGADRTTAFVGVTVVPMDFEHVLADQVVVTQHGRILEVGPTASTPIPPQAERIEGRGLFLIPGLADMHVHLLEGERYFPLFLASGVTTIRNMAGDPDILTLRARTASGAIIGPTIYTAGPLLDGARPVWPGSDIVAAGADAWHLVKAQKSRGYDFLKIYDNLSPAAFQAVAAAAARYQMRIAGHVPPHVGLRRVLDAHVWSIEHLTGYFEYLQADTSPFKRELTGREAFAHPAHLLPRRQALVRWVEESRIPEIARATAEAGTWNVPTLVALRNMMPVGERAAAWSRVGMRYATPMLRQWWNSDEGYTAQDWADKRRGDTVRVAILRALHQAGARVLVGTDAPHPFVLPGFSVHEELAVFVSAGLSPYQALAAATTDAATFLGAPGEFGVIRPGARADLVLVEGNPLTDIRNAARIVGTMVRGCWLSRDTLQMRLDAVRSARPDSRRVRH